MSVKVTHTISMDTGTVRMDALWKDDDLRITVVEAPTGDDAGATVTYDVPEADWRQFVHEVQVANPKPVMRDGGDGRRRRGRPVDPPVDEPPQPRAMHRPPRSPSDPAPEE